MGQMPPLAKVAAITEAESAVTSTEHNCKGKKYYDISWKYVLSSTMFAYLHNTCIYAYFVIYGYIISYQWSSHIILVKKKF